MPARHLDDRSSARHSSVRDRASRAISRIRRPERPLPVPPAPSPTPGPPSEPSLSLSSSKLSAPLHRPSISSVLRAGPSRSSLAWSSAASRRVLGRMLRQPRVLANLLCQLPWGDFHALASTCREFRHDLMHHPECKEILLCHYVPGYQYAIQMGDLRRYREVMVDFHDLTLLVLSQFVPLHKYPMHSLSIINQLAQDANPAQLYESAAKYAALTQAHSRFVLLLQALAPRRRFTTATTASSESSLLSPPSSRSNTEQSSDSGSLPSSHRGSARDIPPPPLAVPQGASPHDLYLATSRVRAPVLRTFVPCTFLDDRAIATCEEQLDSAGLWEHLSVGDVVVNFGYVPPVEGPSSTGSGSASERNEGNQEWMLFDGYKLIKYVPPDPPPLEDPLSLPSPFYYSHILPPFTSPRYVYALPAMPSVCGADLQLTLTEVPTRVRSPRSLSGWAVVKKYVWIARLPYVGPGTVLGRAWQGEWMLEGEGTKEGKQSLLDAVSGGPGGAGAARRGKWEVVREKSGSGRVWMKLLVPNVDHTYKKIAGSATPNVPPAPGTNAKRKH
ncbi:uncharacterized protein LAESUDRAFT_650508 [Laetiporus sulphureus 93-53]|uniref:F-box domain-containing protein n=1 Tax=Laetiporus sulphureus 93-53 TaxID=1314785 RepID=A0A165EUD1_9APHY|nr:uncharacterized protein LAESUDRAFT_650508 [Laetiporus sulphureus 93-53]KZT07781.1 hypothetical protein LAESUDRAFT_650508 [Laetiporus sulphureus 93-53]